MAEAESALVGGGQIVAIEGDKVWVRLPTGQVVAMPRDPERMPNLERELKARGLGGAALGGEPLPVRPIEVKHEPPPKLPEVIRPDIPQPAAPSEQQPEQEGEVRAAAHPADRELDERFVRGSQVVQAARGPALPGGRFVVGEGGQGEFRRLPEFTRGELVQRGRARLAEEQRRRDLGIPSQRTYLGRQIPHGATQSEAQQIALEMAQRRQPPEPLRVPPRPETATEFWSRAGAPTEETPEQYWNRVTAGEQISEQERRAKELALQAVHEAAQRRQR